MNIKYIVVYMEADSNMIGDVEYVEIDIKRCQHHYNIYDNLLLLKTEDDSSTEMFVKELNSNVCCGVVVDNLPIISSRCKKEQIAMQTDRNHPDENIVTMLSIRTIPIEKVRYAAVLVDDDSHYPPIVHKLEINPPLCNELTGMDSPFLNRVVCFDYEKSPGHISHRTILLQSVNLSKRFYRGIDVNMIDTSTKIKDAIRTFLVSKMSDVRLLQVFGDEKSLFKDAQCIPQSSSSGIKRRNVVFHNDGSNDADDRKGRKHPNSLKDVLKTPGEYGLEVEYHCNWRYSVRTYFGHPYSNLLPRTTQFDGTRWWVNISGPDTFEHRQLFKDGGFAWLADEKLWHKTVSDDSIPIHIRDAEKRKEIGRFHSQGLTWPSKEVKCETGDCPNAALDGQAKCHDCGWKGKTRGGLRCPGWYTMGFNHPCSSGQMTEQGKPCCEVCCEEAREDYERNRSIYETMSEGY